MCYSFGYGPAEEQLGRRSRIARRCFSITRCVVKTTTTSLTPPVLPKGKHLIATIIVAGTLWIKARGRAPSRLVVATDEVVATVMRVHCEVGHVDAGSTFDTVKRDYLGIPKNCVK